MLRLEDIQQIESENSDQSHLVYQMALYYVENGLPVIPLRPNSKFLPKKETGVNYDHATVSREIVDDWFHPDNGQFAGWNIGIACGKFDGVFALDLDTKDADGISAWEDILEEEGASIDTPFQVTPSGGRHYLFKWHEFGVSSTNKISKGIDTRGGSKDLYKSHIVAFPSIINGERYEWKGGGDISQAPEFLLQRMGKPWGQDKSPVSGRKGGRGNEHVDEGDLEEHIPIDQVKRMLNSINPDDLSYDEWLKIGQAIHTQHPDDNGLEAWDQWSKKGERYQPGECHTRWEGFEDGGRIRMATLFYFAKQMGEWTPQKGDVGSDSTDEIVAALNMHHAMVVLGSKVRILVEQDREHIDSRTPPYKLLSKEDFGTLMANKHVMTTDAKGNPKMLPAAAVWMAHENRRIYPNGVGLFPEKPEYTYDTWGGFAYEPQPGDVEPMLWHIREIICAGDEKAYEWLLDWLADMVQDPSNPKGTALVMRSEEGTGKGILANLMCDIFGYHSLHLTDVNHLTGNFNAHLADALLVFADEIVWGGNKKSAGKLKGLVTERHLMVERKGVDAIPYKNMVRLIIATNEEWAVPAGPESRRWFVLEVSEKRMGNTEYFRQLMEWIEKDGRAKFLHFLMNREITHDLHRAPHTKELYQQRALMSQQQPVNVWWELMLMKGEVPNYMRTDDDDNHWPEVVDRLMMYELYQSWCDDRKRQAESPSVFYRHMEKFGIEAVRSSRRRKDGKRGYDLKLPPLAKAAELFEKATAIKVDVVQD